MEFTHLPNARLRNSICAHIDARVAILEHHVVRKIEISIVRNALYNDIAA